LCRSSIDRNAGSIVGGEVDTAERQPDVVQNCIEFARRDLTADTRLDPTDDPLGLFDCCGVSDGAAAAIVTRSDLAKKFKDDPIYIKSLAVSVGSRLDLMTQDYVTATRETKVGDILKEVRASKRTHASISYVYVISGPESSCWVWWTCATSCRSSSLAPARRSPCGGRSMRSGYHKCILCRFYAIQWYSYDYLRTSHNQEYHFVPDSLCSSGLYNEWL
jgi:hypothetical protein